MKSFMVKPTVCFFDTAEEFVKEFRIGKGDLVITNQFIYEPFFSCLNLDCDVIWQEKYGSGEPSDDMVEAICRDLKKKSRRVIGIGGGTVLDIAKLLALKTVSPVPDLFDGKTEVVKDKELILVPTTCGTGSEVTNIAVLAFIRRGTKKGLAHKEMYADTAVLIPELVRGLPFRFFATSSIDALIHAVESSLSPKGSGITRLFGYRAIEMILNGYKVIAREGEEARYPLLGDFLTASLYAGMAFSNAGCAAVHAMSYPVGSVFHVPHGESNYAMFTGILRNYMEIRRDGEIEVLNRFIADILGCGTDVVYDELEKLLNRILPRKALHEYGMKEEQAEEFADSVIENQQRLLQNNFVFLDRDRLVRIYRELL